MTFMVAKCRDLDGIGESPEALVPCLTEERGGLSLLSPLSLLDLFHLPDTQIKKKKYPDFCICIMYCNLEIKRPDHTLPLVQNENT